MVQNTPNTWHGHGCRWCQQKHCGPTLDSDRCLQYPFVWWCRRWCVAGRLEYVLKTSKQVSRSVLLSIYNRLNLGLNPWRHLTASPHAAAGPTCPNPHLAIRRAHGMGGKRYSRRVGLNKTTPSGAVSPLTRDSRVVMETSTFENR